MTKHNSLVEFYSSLARCLHADAADKFEASTFEVARDHQEIGNRCDSEGIAFLTKTLPELAKQLDSSLGQGSIFAPEGFERIPGTSLPIFMGGAWTRLFANDGTPLPPPSGEAAKRRTAELVRCTRQFLYAMYKLELPYEKSSTQKVLDDFVSVDAGLEESPTFTGVDNMWINKARSLITSVFAGFDHLDILPKHGPGAVATGEAFAGKFHFRRLYRAIEQVYPFTEYFCYSLSHVRDCWHMFSRQLEERDAGTAKVVLVPKDSRGPRLISAEPLEYQWVQQGLGNKIRQHLESHKLTRGRVNFTHQTINRHLALIGSEDGSWSTLDMKEASDRVSLGLVKTLFSGTRLLEALLATRSVATRLPDGRTVTLKKFAPMGSNLCFPVEALVFYVLCVSALIVYKGLSRREALKRVYVYGDDIVCYTEDCGVILQALPKVGLAFNQKKCNTTGLFRESCGMEAYGGYDITPVRFRTVWRQDRVTAEVVASYVAYSNALWIRGDYTSSAFVENAVQELLSYHGLKPMPYRPTMPIGFDSPLDLKDRGLKGLDLMVELAKLRTSWPLREELPKQVAISFYRYKPVALYLNSLHGVRTRYMRKFQTTLIEGYKIRPKPVRSLALGWEELLGRSISRGGDTSWAEWSKDDVLAEQLRAESRKLGPGWFLDPHSLALASAWGIL